MITNNTSPSKKKTYILLIIGFLLITSILLIFFKVKNKPPLQNKQSIQDEIASIDYSKTDMSYPNLVGELELEQKVGSYITLKSITLENNGTKSLILLADTSNGEIDAFEAHMQYDPNKSTISSITKSADFSNLVFSDIDTQKGLIRIFTTADAPIKNPEVNLVTISYQGDTLSLKNIVPDNSFGVIDDKIVVITQ